MAELITPHDRSKMTNRVEGKKKKKSIKAKVTSKFSQKRKLSRMGKKVRKGEMGASTEFVTRSAVLKKLQITLKDFRRLCILKGIYPRVPTKAPKGADKIYYDIKDISYLAHEPLLANFRDFKAFMKKIRKSAGRNQHDEARRRDRIKPVAKLDHLVKERYPRFIDALRDLDDSLCMIHLFAAMPSVGRITAEKTSKCNQLVRFWQYYIVKSKTLQKVFVSVKGIYFQAEIMGEAITWLMPHQFTQEVPKEVDLRVMMTFLEFYEVYLNFVLYKLYNMQGLKYPPQIDKNLDDAGCCLLSVKAKLLESAQDDADASLKVAEVAPPKRNRPLSASKMESLNKKLEELENEEDEEDEVDDEMDDEENVSIAAPLSEALVSLHGNVDDHTGDEEEKTFAAADDDQRGRLFGKLKFFFNREVPLAWLQLCTLAHGALVGWEGDLSPFPASDPGITHHVVDRPMQGLQDTTREYVQPQWVFDSINAQILLPVHRYRPGAALPPHLSPFVDDDKAGYMPRYQEEIRKLKVAGNSSSLVATETKAGEQDGGSDDDDEAEEDYEAEVRAERRGQAAIPRASVSKGSKVKEVEQLDEGDDEDDTSSSVIPTKGTKGVVLRPKEVLLSEVINAFVCGCLHLMNVGLVQKGVVTQEGAPQGAPSMIIAVDMVTKYCSLGSVVLRIFL